MEDGEIRHWFLFCMQNKFECEMGVDIFFSAALFLRRPRITRFRGGEYSEEGRDRVANPSERINAPYSVKKWPKWGFYYIRAFLKKIPIHKNGTLFHGFLHFYQQRKMPHVSENANLSEKGIKKCPVGNTGEGGSLL